MRSINTEGHFIEWTKYLLRSISPCYQGNSLNLWTFNFLRMLYTWYKFGCDRSIYKGTLLIEKSTFFAVSRLLFKGSHWTYKRFTFMGSSTFDIKLDAIDQYRRALYCLIKVPSSQYLAFCSRDLTVLINISLSSHAIYLF
jgi:hypothetical protein